jgi:diaminopimelate decarboxylase
MKMFDENRIGQLKALPTPYYFYDLEILDATLHSIQEAVKDKPYVVHYAIKANANERVLECVRKAGFGIDTVSGNEIKWALKNGFTGSEIAFAGVGKTDEEIQTALDAEIFTFNVESIPELKVIDALAGKVGKKAPIAIRLNPNVNAKTHHYITTGLEENKFGINYWELNELFEQLESLQNIELRGLHFHIGSQIRDLSVFKNLCNRVNELQSEFRERNIDLDHINVGGGLGVNYQKPDEELIPDFKTFFDIFDQFIELLPNQTLHFELGRAVVAQCAALISKVLFVKEGVKTNFAILDAGMTELIRPALYQSSHHIQNLSKLEQEATEKYDVVGPICESSDCFGKAIMLPKTDRGDLMAIRTAGAYGQVMSSQYNLRDVAKTIYHDEL